MQNSKHIVCPGCTCLCDDIEPPIAKSGPPTKLCKLGQQWFRQPTNSETGQSVDGCPVEFETAIDSAALLMSKARAPLICGLEELTTAGQQAVWKLADRSRANIDVSLSNQGRGSTFALQRTGKVTATLGEVASRSDVVVFWFCNPVLTHPRHLERYSHPDTGRPRTVIVVDHYESETAQQADVFLRLPIQNAAAALCVIRGLLAGHPVNAAAVDQTTGWGVSSWQQFVDRLRAAQYGSWFYGHADNDAEFDLEADFINEMIRELNRQKRFVGIPMRNDRNGLSAENVLTWNSGFPFAVNLQHGYPRFNRLEYSASAILARQETDLVVIFSSIQTEQLIADLYRPAREHFRSCQKIVLANAPINLEDPPDVMFHVARPGFSQSGDFCRQDDVMLPLSDDFRSTTQNSAQHVVEKISNKIYPS